MARKPRPRVTNATPKKSWQEKFIESLSQSPNVTAAAIASGVHRMTAYRERDANRNFAKAWDDALEQSIDHAEGEAYRRAVEGVLKPVYQSKELVGHIREYSDTLLIFLLKAHRPERYRERIGVDIGKLSDAELFALLVRTSESGSPPAAGSGSGSTRT